MFICLFFGWFKVDPKHFLFYVFAFYVLFVCVVSLLVCLFVLFSFPFCSCIYFHFSMLIYWFTVNGELTTTEKKKRSTLNDNTSTSMTMTMRWMIYDTLYSHIFSSYEIGTISEKFTHFTVTKREKKQKETTTMMIINEQQWSTRRRWNE